jgi:hypothetical protein
MSVVRNFWETSTIFESAGMILTEVYGQYSVVMSPWRSVFVQTGNCFTRSSLGLGKTIERERVNSYKSQPLSMSD